MFNVANPLRIDYCGVSQNIFTVLKNEHTQNNAGKGPSGSMMEAPERVPSHWLPFVLVRDIKESTAKAKTLGATVMVDPTDISEGGRFSVLIDPTRATLGLYEPPA